MPYRRRRPTSRPTYRRRRTTRRTIRRRAVKRTLRKRSRVQAISAKFKVVIPVTTDTNGDFYLKVQANADPEGSTTTAMLLAGDPASLTAYTFTEGSNYAALYDNMRCAGLRFRFIPSAPADESATTAYRPFYWTTRKSGWNSTEVPDTVSEFIQQNKLGVKNLYRPFDKYTKSLYYRLYTKFPMSPAAETTPMGYWHDTALSSVTDDTTHMVALIDGATASKNYGQLIVTGYFQYKDRQPVA